MESGRQNRNDRIGEKIYIVLHKFVSHAFSLSGCYRYISEHALVNSVPDCLIAETGVSDKHTHAIILSRFLVIKRIPFRFQRLLRLDADFTRAHITDI